MKKSEIRALASALLLLPALSPADIVPGLEEFGELTLVDSIECATDTTHRWRDYPSGRSYATNILGAACVAMHPVANSETPNGQRQASYVAWRVGEGKGIVPGEPYVLAIDYPDEAPRSASVMNFGNWTIHGFATGFATPDCYWPEYVHPLHESYALPLSGGFRTFKEAMFPMEQCEQVETAQKDGAQVYDLPSNGFDVVFALFSADRQPDSLGVAVKAIRLYHVDDYAAAKPEIHYPLGGAPRRHVTFREEMGDGYMLEGYRSGNKTAAYRDKARLMSLLGVDTTSRDLLEFGYLQYWDSSYSSGRYGHANGSSRWGSAANYWDETVRLMAEEGHYILPYYEYSGGRGGSGWGNVGNKPVTLRAGNGGFSNQSWINSALADITEDGTRDDMKELLDLTLLRFANEPRYEGVFLGAWFRNRFQVPMGFSDRAIAKFNADRGYSTTRLGIYAALTNEQARILAAGGTADWTCKEQWGPQVYRDYRDWWYLKRRDLFAELRRYLATNGVPAARLFYHPTQAEPGEQWDAWSPPNSVHSPDESCLWNGTDWKTFTGFSGSTDMAGLAAGYKAHSLDQDFGDGQGWEYGHANPRHDPEHYAGLQGVALSYPYSRVFQVADPAVSAPYRNASGDLFFVRHYSLNEHNLQDKNLGDDERQQIAGYFCSDYDHAGRGVNLPELWAMAVADPTMLARLYGTNLGQLDSGYFREFNLNFLSLPAQPGELVCGGAWGDRLHVRKWSVPATNGAPACTYFAVINTDVRPYEGPVPFAAGIDRLWRTVDYGEVALAADGTATLSLEPLQMVALRSVPPDAPAVRVSVPAPDGLEAEARVEVLALPVAPGTLSLSWSTRTDGLGGDSAGPVALDGAGPRAFALAGLDPAAKYYVRAVVAGADGAACTNVTSFRTPAVPGYPHAALSVRKVGASSATLVLDFDSLGAGASSVAVYATVEDAAGLFPAQTFSFEGPVYPTAVERVVTGLSSELVYHATLRATNSLGRGCALGSVAFATTASPPQDPGGGQWEPGLVQHRFKVAARAVPDTSMRVADVGDEYDERALGPLAGAGDYTNPLTGTQWKWNNFPDGTAYNSPEAYRGGFLYEGAMWFEGGVDYDFYHRFSENANVWLDDAQSSPSPSTTGGYSNTSYWTVRYDESGWHPIRIWFWAFNGSYGPQGGLKWGLGWNTNGLKTASSGSAGWSQLLDPGDGSLLRTYDPRRLLADIDRPVARSGTALVVPVRVEAFDADSELAVFAAASIPADPHDPTAWTGSAVGSVPPVGVSRQEISIAGAAPAAGGTAYAIACLRNARTGVESWSDVAVYERPAASVPEVFASLVSVSPHAATFSVRVQVPSGTATLSAALSGASSGNWTVASGLTSSSAAVEWTVPVSLAPASDFSVVFTATVSGASGSSGAIAFSTPDRNPPSATLAATVVSFQSESFRVDVADLGTDSSWADVTLQLSDSETFASGVLTRTARVGTAGGSATFDFSSLSPGTVYWARAVVAGSAGLSFTTPAQRVPTAAYTPPVFGRLAAADLDCESATLSVELLDLGAGTDAATVSWTCSGAGRTLSGRMDFSDPATKTASLAGLVPETEYAVSLSAAGANAQNASASFTFAPPRAPVLLGSARADVARDGTSVSLSATVARADTPATLSLYVAGALVQSWTGLAAGETRTLERTVALGSTNAWRFVLVDASGAHADERGGTFVARHAVAWFEAPFEDAAYDGWTFAAGADPYGGGSWTRDAADATAFDAVARHLDVATPAGGSALYAATAPSEAGRDVLVAGRVRFSASAAPLAAEAPGTRAGLVLHVEPDGSERLYGYDGAAWHALAGSPQPASDEWVDYEAEFAFSAGAPAVRYAVGGAVFARASDGAEWIPLVSASPRALEGVAFDGVGAAGAFRADRFDCEGAVEPPAGAISVADVAHTSAVAVVAVASLGDGGGPVGVTVELATRADFAGARSIPAGTADAAGERRVALDGLDPGTAYFVRAILSGASTATTPVVRFKTLAYGPPVFGAVAVSSVSFDSASVSFALADLGSGSDTASVALSLSPGGQAPSCPPFTTPGAQTLALTGLSPETAYTVALVATASSGLSATTNLFFSTPARPRLALGEPVVEVDAGGTNATVSVLVESSAPGAVLALTWNGETVASWTSPAAGAAFTNRFAIAVGSTNEFAFVLSADGVESAERSGRAVGRRLVDWFHVQWTRDGYEPGAGWDVPAARDASGGEWERPEGDSSALSGGTLAFALGGNAVLRFRATSPAASPAGEAVLAEGRLKLRAQDAPAAVADGTVAALALVGGDGAEPAALHAWTGAAGWTALAGEAPADGDWIDWSAEADFSAEPPAVRFSVDGAVRPRASDGAEWIPLAASAASLHGVAFGGSGETGDFRAKFYDAGAEDGPELLQVALAEVGAGLSFVSSGTADEAFRIRLAEPVPGLWYAVFAATELVPEPDRWICVGFAAAPPSGALEFDAATAGFPARFFQLWTASREVTRPETLAGFLSSRTAAAP